MGDAKHPSGGTGRYDTLSAESSSDSGSEVTVTGPEAALEPLPREGLDGAGPQKGAESAGSAGSTCAEGSSSRPAVSINAAFTFAPVVNVHSGSNVNISFNISAGANAPSVQFSPLVGTGPSGEVSLPRDATTVGVLPGVRGGVWALPTPEQGGPARPPPQKTAFQVMAAASKVRARPMPPTHRRRWFKPLRVIIFTPSCLSLRHVRLHDHAVAVHPTVSWLLQRAAHAAALPAFCRRANKSGKSRWTPARPHAPSAEGR
jgi:hypothetical protein